MSFEVFTRYLLNSPTSWVSDFVSYALSASVFLALPKVTRERGHVAVTILVDVMPDRVADWAHMAVSLIGFACLGIAAWISLEENIRQYSRGIETLAINPIPVWWVSSFITFGLAMSALYMLRHLPPSHRGRSGFSGGRIRLMEWYVTLLAGLAILFLLFLSGAPIFLAFLSAILVGIFVIIGPSGFPMLANSILDTSSITSLASIPLFILMGELLFRSGTMDVLFDSIDKLVGRIRGRQYVLVVVLSAVFGALSGVAMAVAAMLGRAIIPGMQARGYDRDIAAGLIVGGASLAPIIPPSLLAIIVGSLADVSIAKLLIAGVVPGLAIGGIFWSTSMSASR